MEIYPGDGYRLLKVGDYITYGDEIFNRTDGQWEPGSHLLIGCAFSGLNPFRRKLNEQERHSKPEPTTPESILTEAERIINGPRRDAYGPVEESFERIASVWQAIMKRPVSAHQVALCMIGLKLCREANKPDRENRVDLAGYTALGDKVAPK